MADREEREATDAPPPVHGPMTRAQVISLVVPAVSFVLLIALLLWGTLSNVRPIPAAQAATPPATGTSAATPVAASTLATALPAATPPPAPANPPPTTAADSPTVAPSVEPTSGAAATPSAVPKTATVPPPTGSALPTTAAAPTTPAGDPAPGGTADKPLLGRRIGLDPGHGPRRDLGAVLVDPKTDKLVLSEDELNLDVALRCRDLLEARGAKVGLTRETADTFTVPWPPDTNGDGIKNGQADELQHRIDILNDFHSEVFLSIHANSSSNPAKRQGIQAVYCATDDCAFPAENKRVGKLVLDHLETELAAAGDPVQARELRNDMWSDTPDEPPSHLFMLGPVDPPRHVRAMQMPGVVIESLYVTSPLEAAQLNQDAVRQAIARAYADALQEFLLEQGR
ncbi:MAG TPA: N-acetylmuramoyl-L-alanine amidase [Chloroflexia bacterium]|nr:N-acetylmuramoyl-L-alanine amidase [Chloroflexia bacterium]